MRYFTKLIIKSYFLESGYRSLCEIGAQRGDNTNEYLEIPSVVVDIIDPCIDADLAEKFRDSTRVNVHKGLSLDVLKGLSGQFDCILIDGDHNWYTVYNELNTIQKRGLLKQEGTIFLHDVGWPYGRRDMYYLPESIPKEHMQPSKKQRLVRGQSLVEDATDHSETFSAEAEGGAKNGVLTAVEDFLKENGSQYKFFWCDEEHGLGVLLRTKNPIGNPIFLKHLLRAQYRSARNRLKGLARDKFPSIYSSLRELRGKTLRKS
jgi:hypothetical protein